MSGQGNEFALIRRFFQRVGGDRGVVQVDVGDDCAVVAPGSAPLAISIDTMVEGVHFPEGANAEDIGYRALAVSMSDLAAMAVNPAWFTLALTLPDYDEAWLTDFSTGLHSLASALDVPLIGGDTTRGALTITVQVAGYAESAPLIRSGAQPGDVILVSGTLGDATAGLHCVLGRHEYCQSLPEESRAYFVRKYYRPMPRFDLVPWLQDYATAGIDVSDGLLADLSHILDASGVGAEIQASALPLSAQLQSLPEAERLQWALAGGDDYELCVCVSPEKWASLAGSASQWTQIGVVTESSGMRVRNARGDPMHLDLAGYQHF